jgi:hypothetical protein
MQTINPGASHKEGVIQFQKSAHKALSGALTQGNPTGQNALGVYNRFQQDNMNGVLLRIGNAASSEPIKWVTTGVGVAINHGLHHQPIGFYIVDKDGPCDVYRTISPPTADLITLATTDATVNVTVYIF